jgi:hypothetical protein
LEHGHPRRPCPKRALSTGPQRSSTDNHGRCPCRPSCSISPSGAVRGSFPSSRCNGALSAVGPFRIGSWRASAGMSDYDGSDEPQVSGAPQPGPWAKAQVGSEFASPQSSDCRGLATLVNKAGAARDWPHQTGEFWNHRRHVGDSVVLADSAPDVPQPSVRSGHPRPATVGADAPELRQEPKAGGPRVLPIR